MKNHRTIIDRFIANTENQFVVTLSIRESENHLNPFSTYIIHRDEYSHSFLEVFHFKFFAMRRYNKIKKIYEKW